MNAYQACTNFAARPKDNIGKRIANLEKQLIELHQCELAIKHRMQDRLKFMSAKNVYRADRELSQIEHKRDMIKMELNRLQEQ